VGVPLLEPFKLIDVPVEEECLRCGTRGRQSVHVMRYSKVVCQPCARVTAGLSGRLSSAAVRKALANAEMDLIGEYVGARIPVLVRCRVCGAESYVRLANVRNKSSRCRACADQYLSRLFRLSDTDVAARAALAGIELMEPFRATHERILVHCLNCGYESRRKLAWSMPAKGCVRCGARPFDFTAPSQLYLLSHTAHAALKIGVTNRGTNRLAEHQREGWLVVGTFSCDGETAYAVEQAVLRWWRDELDLPQHLTATEVPQGGWTETVSAEAVSVPEVLSFIRAAMSFAMPSD
jgi:hypothetical protein